MDPIAVALRSAGTLGGAFGARCAGGRGLLPAPEEEKGRGALANGDTAAVTVPCRFEGFPISGFIFGAAGVSPGRDLVGAAPSPSGLGAPGMPLIKGSGIFANGDTAPVTVDWRANLISGRSCLIFSAGAGASAAVCGVAAAISARVGGCISGGDGSGCIAGGGGIGCIAGGGDACIAGGGGAGGGGSTAAGAATGSEGIGSATAGLVVAGGT
jgi:hypothetical protein